MISTENSLYQYLKTNNAYSEELTHCMEQTVEKLMTEQTSTNKPGMLLGKIQSGKTRAFIGIIGLAFDNDFDVTIVLTKNSNALAKQTYERLSSEFQEPIENDQLRVFDIMALPGNLKKYELSQKLAFVVKKEARNMERLQEALSETYPQLQERRVLFIDDEADFASVAYEHQRESNLVEMRKIASQIDWLRKSLSSSAYLQVTATPYSLYLQPDDMVIHEHKWFAPIRPAFTVLVPIHDKYVGGEMYFEASLEEGHMARYLFHEVKERELEALKKQDRRRVKADTVLTSGSVEGLRTAFVNFLVGACWRRWQAVRLGEKREKYSFIIHTERGKAAHEWQGYVVETMEAALRHLALEDGARFSALVKDAYWDMWRSMSTLDLPQPGVDEVVSDVREALLEEYVITSVVNSERDVDEMLDQTGQLQLRGPLNIFIGGQILDRGVTIRNLIGFYYGRNPKRFQQDTVLQHSRMYGARPLEDVAVTRFYTTQKIYEAMRTMHEFDRELRRAIEKGGQDQGVVFIEQSHEEIVPCSPNKLLLSDMVMLKPGKRLLPVGFQTGYKTHIEKTVKQIDAQVKALAGAAVKKHDGAGSYLVRVEDAKKVLALIHSTLVMEEGRRGIWKNMKRCLITCRS
ncbi:Z1 domain-containing protein [Texcoconibacillus texcoconensis]|uniref:Putative endonuclease Z1 domain-containing protein n=1 Tax=Texcoconibacillus texcoconensis TaxID=1095777 RepID=A0A840QPY3_9BACI|nr:Z1 domain-containing protein [Texcoconibacillus texcoconensis]MBB5173377.1 hypothetical protein [Texcoconibacillus texcoconensis]